jgi:hypothetical protein
MRTENLDKLGDWLEAERTGRSEEADRAFASIARTLPILSPSRRFAANVMARVAPRTQPLASWWTAWGVRAAVAASLVTLGVVFGTWSARSMLFAAVATAQALAWELDQVVTGGVVWIEIALTMWGSVAHAAAVVGRLLITPGPAMLVSANLAVAACACAALQRLLASQEE